MRSSSSVNNTVASEAPSTHGVVPEEIFVDGKITQTLGHPPALTAASDAAVHVTFSCTHTAVRGPCYKQFHSSDSNSKKKKKKVSFLDLRYF